MFSPFTVIKILELVELISVMMLPVSFCVSITLSAIVLYVGLSSFILNCFFNKDRSIGFSFYECIQQSFFVYIICFTLSGFINSELANAIEVFINSVTVYLTYLWVRNFIEVQRRASVYVERAFLLASIISIAYGSMQLLGFDFLHRLTGARLTGFHTNSYTFAGQMIVFFFFLVAQFIACENKNKIKKISCFILSMAAYLMMIQSGQRAVIAGVTLAFIFYVVYILKKSTSKFSKLALPFTVLVPYLVTMIFKTRVSERIHRAAVFDVNIGENPRIILWGKAIELFKKEPLFGSGKFPNFVIQGKAGYTYNLDHAHNVYLQLMATTGIVGLFGFFALVFGLIYEAIKKMHISPFATAFLAAFLAFLIEGMFEFNWGDAEVRNLLIVFAAYSINAIKIEV